MSPFMKELLCLADSVFSRGAARGFEMACPATPSLAALASPPHGENKVISPS
jgi:hypothetical protein